MSEQQQDAEIFVVSDDETVYRLISSPTGYNEVTGVSPDCFKLFRKNESYVSVERAKYCSLDDALSNGNKIKMWFADVLALQTYLSGIVEQVVMKDLKKDQ